VALAVEDKRSVGDLPMCPHIVIGLCLCPGQLILSHLQAGLGISHEALPAGEVCAVEKGLKALRRLI